MYLEYTGREHGCEIEAFVTAAIMIALLAAHASQRMSDDTRTWTQLSDEVSRFEAVEKVERLHPLPFGPLLALPQKIPEQNKYKQSVCLSVCLSLSLSLSFSLPVSLCPSLPASLPPSVM